MSSARLGRTFPLVLIVAGALMWPLLMGAMPLTADHPVHLYKAWLWWERLAAGSIGGWSNNWFFGYPIEDLYHPGVDLWVAALRALTLAQLSWEHTYALAIAAVYALGGVAGYVLGRRLYGEIGGLVAGLLMLTDVGAFREGGFVYTVEWGVWTQALGTGFFLLGLAELLRALDLPSRRSLGLAGLYFGLGILGHPVCLIFMAATLPLLLLSRVTLGRRPPLPELARLAVSAVIGAAVAGLLLVPLILRADQTVNIGERWEPWSVVWPWLLSLAPWTNVYTFWVVLALGAGGVGLARRDWRAAWLLAIAVIFVLFPVAEIEQAASRLVPVLSRVQFGRLVPLSKYAALLLASGAVAAMVQFAWATARAHPRAPGAPTPGTPARVGAALVVLPTLCAAGLLTLSAADVRARLDQLDTTSSSRWWPAYLEMAEWLAGEVRSSPGFFRTASVLAAWHDHRLMAAPMYTGAPIYRVGYTPAKLFRQAPDRLDPDVLRALSVKYVITDGPFLKTLFTPVREFGPFTVWRFEDYSPTRAWLEGPGTLQTLRFGEEEMAFEVQGAGPQTHLRLHVAPYVRWEATQGGARVPIESAKLRPEDPYEVGMRIPVRDGQLRVEYVLRPLDVAGRALTVCGLTAACVLALSRWKQRPR